MQAIFKFAITVALSLTARCVFGQVGNDDCSTATNVIVNNATVCDNGFVLPGTTADAVPSGAGTCAPGASDVWYSFVATSGAQNLRVFDVQSTAFSWPDYFTVEWFRGDCADLQSQGCQEFYENGVIGLNGLTPGGTYYFRLFQANDRALSYQLCITTPSAPPPNDDCANAMVVDNASAATCTTYLHGTTVNSSYYDPLTACPDCVTGNDVWYTFTATQTTHTVHVSGVYGVISPFWQNVTVTAYGGSCSALQSLDRSKTIQGSDSLVLNNLQPGQPCYLRFFNWIGSDYKVEFDVCVAAAAPPPNDACAAAQPIVPQPDFDCTAAVAGTLYGAALTGADCAGAPAADVWYKFTATGASLRLDAIPPATADTFGVEVFGGECGNLTSVACNQGPTPGLTLTAMTAGQTYYVRVFSDSYRSFDFDLCLRTLPAAPANTACAQAVALTSAPFPDCSSPYTAATAGILSPAPGACQAEPGYGTWYSFQAVATTQLIWLHDVDKLFGDRNLYFVETYEGAGCGSLTPLQCDTNATLVYLNNLTVGATYYLRFANPAGAAYSIGFCLHHYPAPPNDDCAGALEIMSCSPWGGGATGGSTAGGTPTPLAGCTANAGDVWYRFFATGAVHSIHFSSIADAQTGVPASIRADLWTGGCANPTQIRCCQEVFNGSGSIVAGGLTPGNIYLVRVSSTDDLARSFQVCFETPPPPPVNDECATATILQPWVQDYCYTTYSTTQYATSSPGVIPVENCAAGDVWYAFTATQAQHFVELSSVSAWFGSYPDTALIEAYSGTCGGLTKIAGKLVTGAQYFTLNDLQPGTTYYLRVMPVHLDYVVFGICVASPAPPLNDECAGALPLPIAADLNCGDPLSVQQRGSTPSRTDCAGAPSNDIWYQFTADATVYRFDINQYAGPGGYEILTGTCNQLQSVLCMPEENFSGPRFHDGFVPGNTYYLRLYNASYGSPHWIICTRPMPPAPPNDLCAAATPITVNPDLHCNTVYPGTTLGAGPGTGPHYFDQWYRFTATADEHYAQLRNVATIFGPAGRLKAFVYSGSDCSDLELKYSFQPNEDGKLWNLTVGQSYWIRVFSEEAAAAYSYELCLRTMPPPPPNITCAEAITVTPNAGLDCALMTAGTTAGSPSTNVLTDCVNAGYYDLSYVWYAFTATMPNHRLELKNVERVLGNGDYYVRLLEGPDCQQLSTILCYWNTPVIDFIALTPGATYYLQIAANNYAAFEFDICLQTYAGPSNDLCADATVLSLSPDAECTSFVAGSTVAASASVVAQACGTDGTDVWYTFTATQTAHTVTLRNAHYAFFPFTGPFYLELYEGLCGDLKKFVCRPPKDGGDQFTAGDLTPGASYFVRVVAANYEITFEICVATPPAPPPNDACAAAVPLPVAAGPDCADPVWGTTQYATPSPLNVLDEPEADVWYTFIATQATHEVVVSHSGPWYSQVKIAVYAGACGAFTLVRESASSNYLVLTHLTPGTTYFIRVFEPTDAVIDFQLCVQSYPPPPNDECAGATVLTIEPAGYCQSTAGGSTLGATQSAPGCDGSAVNDLWYRFTATGANHRLVISAYYPSAGKYGFELFAGPCGAQMVATACAEYPAQHTFTLHGLTPGQVYFLRLYVLQHDFTDFDVCVQAIPDNPPNDACAQATLIEPGAGPDCGPVYQGTTVAATGAQTTCNGYPSQDVWYRFTAASTSYRIELQFLDLLEPWSTTALGVEVYVGNDCSDLTSVMCSENYVSFLSNLSIGATYFIRVYGLQENHIDFSLCLRTLPPVPANNVCDGAQVVVPSPNMLCGSPAQGSTGGLGGNENYWFTCHQGTSLWYRFTATSDRHFIQLRDTVQHFGDGYLALELYSGACGQLNPIYCAFSAPAIDARYLVIGQDYLIRVVGQQSSAIDFALCVLTVTPPANDACVQAQALPVAPTLDCPGTAAGTNLGASEFPGCSYGPSAFYSFVATGLEHVVLLNDIQTPDNSSSAYVEVYEGDCNGNLNTVTCYPATSPPEMLTDLVAGQTYYVRISTPWYDYIYFNICIGTPPTEIGVYSDVAVSNNCAPGNDEAVAIWFYNYGPGTLPADAASFTLTVSGANTGVYGPLVYPAELASGGDGSLTFTGVDLSNPGVSEFVVVCLAPNDPVNDNNQATITFVGAEPILTFYRDADGDGYGAIGSDTLLCFAESGFVDISGDCDDQDYYVSPGAAEICNQLDDNCNGLVDLDDPDFVFSGTPAIDCPQWITTQNDPMLCTAVVDYPDPTVGDCGMTLVQTAGLPSGANFPVGYTQNTFIVSDPLGNQNTCSFTIVVTKTLDPDHVYAYTILAFKDLLLKANYVVNGGVGVIGAGKKARLQAGTTVTSEAFVKAPVLELQGGSTAPVYYPGAVPAAILPPFVANTAPGANNVVVPSNGGPVTLTLASYGNITVGANATVIFEGQPTVRIKELVLRAGAVAVFSANTDLLVSQGVSIGRNAIFNSDQTPQVQVYAGKNVTVYRGANVTANIYTLQSLWLEKAFSNQYTVMRGMFIARDVYAQEYVQWFWNDYFCPAAPPIRPADAADPREDRLAAPASDHALRIVPNPAADHAEVEFYLDTAAEATLQLIDPTGQVVQTHHLAAQAGSNRQRLWLHELPAGIYAVRLFGAGLEKTARLIVLRAD